MTQETLYPYTQDDINQAYSLIAPGIFSSISEPDTDAPPAMLIVAGSQGSGKTYLLEKTLLKTDRYKNFIRPYLLEYREHHPHYQEMIKKGVLHAYHHTEKFIWELGQKIFQDAFEKGYSIIIETALDSIEFAKLPAYAATKGYTFEVHLIGCKREFAHISTIERALKSIEDKTLERFVMLSNIDDSMANAQSILTAFENACAASVGSTITMYERGFGALRDRRVVCQSRCTQPDDLTPEAITHDSGETVEPEDQALRIIRTPEANKPCSFNNYAKLVNAPIVSLEERGETLKASHIALAKAERSAEPVPYQVFNDLYAYVVKYVFR